MRPLLAVLALCTALSPVAASSASAHGPRARPMHRPAPMFTSVRVSLQSEHGTALPSAMHHGATFVAGELGERYAIRIDNDGAERLEVVVAVDGRDVISGKLADATRQRGYVVEPFGSLVIDGFRRSTEHVAAFRFTDVADSFSGRMGTPQHAGTIAVSVFRERAMSRPLAPIARARPSTSAPTESKRSKDAAAPKRPMHGHGGEKLGTEFGETTFSPVIEVPFVRRSPTRADQRVQLAYDSRERLLARGVPLDPVHRAWAPEERGWPAARTDPRFTAPPPR